MDAPAELGEFLRIRRARLQPEDVGLVSYGSRRRVPGLRREELARLAGVSVAYYTRLEQGQSVNASASVLDAIARALRLTDDEYAYLRGLAGADQVRRRAPEHADQVRPGTKQLITAMPGVPAVVVDRHSDILAWNAMGHALIAGHLAPAAPDRPESRPNLHRLLFLDPRTRELYADWPCEAERAVAFLRVQSGRDQDNRRLAGLIAELTEGSAEFAELWSRHPVRGCVSGTKLFRHPLAGAMELAFERLETVDGSGHWLLLFSARPGSPAEAGLRLLGDVAGGAPPLRDQVAPPHSDQVALPHSDQVAALPGR
jgi:transcriptional regulator with XRE-family HTH domain